MKEPCKCKITSCISKEKKYCLVFLRKLNTGSELFYQNYCWILSLRKLSHKSITAQFSFFIARQRGGVKKRTPSSNGLIFSLPIGNYATPLTLLGLPFTTLYGISPAFTTRACFIQVSRVWS